MLRLLNRYGWLLLLAAGMTTASAFSLLGPNNEAYQVPEIGYNPNTYIDTLPAGPKNIGEEYRRTIPTLYYSFDQNFLDFFGSNGVAAVDQAFAILNNLTNVSQYSADLSEFPLETLRQNYRAGALGLTDLKSVTMGLLVEQLGLAEPERFTWTLHSRFRFPGNPPPCPDGMGYFVVKRNFDPQPSPPDQFQYSSYVNGTLYSYVIQEYCTAGNSPTPPMLADAVEFPVDPLANTFTAVASARSGLSVGGFYTSLTRDDVGGLRYLLRTNNMNVESAGPGTLTVTTNFDASQLLVTSNLTELVAAALTNTAPALEALYPGLTVASTTNFWVNVVTTNVYAYYTNYPWSPPGSAATLVIASNYTTNVEARYLHTFANVVTNTYYTHAGVLTLITNVAPAPWGPPGTLRTNVTLSAPTLTNLVSGDYYIIPPGSCGVSVISTQLTTVVTITNTPLVATNVPGVTNVNGQQYSESTVFFFTNNYLIVYPKLCQDNLVTLWQGIEKVRFVRRDFDSLLGQFFEPVTNQYTKVAVTNSTALPLTVIRRVTQPDILFTAQDMAGGPGGFDYSAVRRNVPFATNALPGLAGPGTIDPGATVIYNKVGLMYENYRLDPSVFLDELTAFQMFVWGSFDATTNAPVVYPNGTSITNLENMVLIQISPNSLPDGSVGLAYNASFSVNGGSPPYLWSLSPGAPGLPPGLDLSSGGTISGTPTAAGTYDIVIRLTDGSARTVDRPYAISINP